MRVKHETILCELNVPVNWVMCHTDSTWWDVSEFQDDALGAVGAVALWDLSPGASTLSGWMT
jgi:hypothetical protein